MGGSPSVPAMPDPFSVAQQQQQYNTQSGLQSQAGSMVNQANPYGSLQYSVTGTDAYGNPQYSANMAYNQPTQQLFNQAQQAAGSSGSMIPTFNSAATGTLGQSGQNFGQAANAANNSNALINTGLGEIASGNYGNGNNIAGQTGALTNQMMGLELNSLSPFMNMQTTHLDTSLQNKGIMPGTTAYDRAMLQNQYGQGLTMSNAAAQFEPQAYNQAVSQYTLPATIGEGLVSSGLGTGQLGQGYSQTGYGANSSAAGLYGAGLSGLAGMESMTPGMSQTLTQTPGLNIQPSNLNAAVSTYDQNSMQAYQAQTAQQNAMYSALGGIGGAALGGWARGGFTNPF